MQAAERNFLVQYLRDCEQRFLAITEHLTPAQQRFRVSADGWSIADIVEHVTVVEDRFLNRIEKRLAEPPEAEKKSRPDLDAVILNVVPTRTRKIQAPEAAAPAGRWPDFGEAVDQFRKARARSIHLAATTSADVRAYLIPHPLADELDVYQVLLFFGSHGERHRKQAQEIKDDRRFPRR